MKFKVVHFLVILAVVSPFALVNAAEIKVASVDVRKIFNTWEYASKVEVKMEQKRASLDREDSERRAAINKYKAERNQLVQQYRANGEDLTREEVEKLDQKYLNLSRDVDTLEENRKAFYKKRELSIARDATAQSEKILGKISKAVQAHAKSARYDMVVDVSGYTSSHTSLFMHIHQAVDITDIIIRRLNVTK